MKLRYLAIALLAAGTTAAADSYNFELGLAAGQGETGSLDNDIIAADATVYFQAVDTSNGPLREAAFLDKASSLSLNYFEIEPDGGESSDATDVSGRFVTQSDWIFVAGLGQESDTPLGDVDSITVGAGKYLTDTSDLVFSYTSVDDDGDGSDAYAVDYHNLMSLGNGTHFGLDLGLAYSDFDSGDSTDLTAGGTWYPNANLGLGAHLTTTSGDADGELITLEAEYFISSNFSASLVYGTGDENDVDNDAVLVGVALRF